MQRGTQSKDEFQRKRLAQMGQAYDKLYRVDKQGIRNGSYWRKSAISNICASPVLEMKRDQECIGAVDELFSLENARVACKKYRQHHYAPFEDATLMSLFQVVDVITEPVDNFEWHTYMQDMCPMKTVRGHKSEVEGHLGTHRKWSSGRWGRIRLRFSEPFRKLL